MSDEPKWPEDWPEDAKIGRAFLRELMRRYPDQVQIGTPQQALDWLKKTDKNSDAE